jgi:hypothetical protein
MSLDHASIIARERRNAMKTVFFLLLRLICYPALVIVFAAGVALLIVKVNGQCPPMNDFAITCATKLSERLATFGLNVVGFALDTGAPLVLAVGGLIFLMRDVRRWRT